MTAVADAIKPFEMKTAVVILNWNTEGFLKDFLPGLLRSVENTDGAKVIVADNASTDGSQKLMKEVFPQVRTLVFEKNLGFTGGYNEAFRQLLENDRPEYFLLINSDIEVTDGWLEPLVRWMDTHPDCGACAPKLHSWQDRDMFEYAGAAGGYIDRFGYPFCRGRILKTIEKDKGQYDSPADVLWATGACLMVRSCVYESLGGLDERFFAHMEEIDLCWRMQLAGWKVTVVPESVVYHVGGGTLPASSPFKLFLNYRNNLLMLEKNLARTFALAEYRKGMSAGSAASKGLKKAAHRIAARMALDWLSAIVYIVRGKKEDFKAVWKAHEEFFEIRTGPGRTAIMDYLVTTGEKASVTGIYKKWIILASALKGKELSGSIKDKDFYKIG